MIIFKRVISLIPIIIVGIFINCTLTAVQTRVSTLFFKIIALIQYFLALRLSNSTWRTKIKISSI